MTSIANDPFPLQSQHFLVPQFTSKCKKSHETFEDEVVEMLKKCISDAEREVQRISLLCSYSTFNSKFVYILFVIVLND
jgi:hypothetical protein